MIMWKTFENQWFLHVSRKYFVMIYKEIISRKVFPEMNRTYFIPTLNLFYFCCCCFQKFVKGKCFGELLRMIPKHPAKSFTDFRWDNHPGLCHDSQNLRRPCRLVGNLSLTLRRLLITMDTDGDLVGRWEEALVRKGCAGVSWTFA